MASIAYVARIQMISRLSARDRIVMTGNAATDHGHVINRNHWRPNHTAMAQLALVVGINVVSRLPSRNRVVMASEARPRNLSVIHLGGRPPGC